MNPNFNSVDDEEYDYIEDQVDHPESFTGDTSEPTISGKRLIARCPYLEPIHFSKVIINTVNAISKYFSILPLCYTGFSLKRLDLTESDVAEWLEDVRTSSRKGRYKSLALSSHPKDANYISVGFVDRWYAKDYNELSIQLHSEGKELFAWKALFGSICFEFGAYSGYIYDSWLSELHGRKLRSHEISDSEDLPETDEDENLTTKVPDILPPLLLINEFDTELVPDGVWWLNFWSLNQINNLGRNNVLNAGWAQITELSDGSFVLVATEEVTDVRNVKHLEQISKIVLNLKLREYQDKFLISPKNT